MYPRTLSLLATLVDFAGTVVIIVVAFVSLWRYCRSGFTGNAAGLARLMLAQGLVFALSFKTGAGLIRTITVGNWQQFISLFLIVALRFFLGRVLKAEATRSSTNQVVRPSSKETKTLSTGSQIPET